jgi:hypothetical protein
MVAHDSRFASRFARHAERDVDLFDGEIVFEIELERL